MQIDLRPTCAGLLFLFAACNSDQATPAADGGSPADPTGAAGGSSTASDAGKTETPAPDVGSTAGSAGAGASTAGSAGKAAAGSGGRSGSSGSGTAGTGTAGAAAGSGSEHFSFFVTSYAAMQRLSGSPNGFGGDLRFNKADGLSGADEICRQIADTAMPGAGAKAWRAFLSVTQGPDGTPVNAIDRVGEGPWYDRLGRIIALNKTALSQARPLGAETIIINDLPNEDGVPNHAPDGMQVDNHDTLTGSSATGTLYNSDWSATCHDWTSSIGSDGKPRVGHSWARARGGGNGRGGMSGGNGAGTMDNWMSSLTEAGCAAGASLVEMGGPIASNPTVGSGGGYGGIYCFALTP